MFPRWNVVECDTTTNVWAQMGLPVVTRSHTPAWKQVDKNPRASAVWLFVGKRSQPKKYGFMFTTEGGRGLEAVVCWSVGRQDEESFTALASVLVLARHATCCLVLNHRVRLRICLQSNSVSCSQTLPLCTLHQENKYNVPWERERDNERCQVSNSYWECENQERPGRSQQQPSLVSKDVGIKCQFLISNLQFSSSFCCWKIRL